MNDRAPPRRIWLCADDYGMADGVNRAILDLIARGRLNATSVMMVGAAIGRRDADLLQETAANSPRCAIGLHATLSAPFRPLTMFFRPTNGGLFLPFATMLRSGLLRRLDAGLIEDELHAQLAAFRDLFGRAPDFVDGHQHVQLYPQVRDGFLRVVKDAAPDAWVRQGGRTLPLARRLAAPKALVLDTLSAQFRNRAARSAIAFNPAFAGAYDFTRAVEFGALMQQFVEDMPEGGLVMCHPGFVDDTLVSLDPLTTQREAEHAYLAGEQFPRLLEANNVTLG